MGPHPVLMDRPFAVRSLLALALCCALVGVGYRAGELLSDPTAAAADGVREGGRDVSEPARSKPSPATDTPSAPSASSDASAPAGTTMPQVVSMSEADARAVIGPGQAISVRYVLAPTLVTDTVLSQSPSAGQPMTGQVSLVVHRQARKVTLNPRLVGPGWSGDSRQRISAAPTGPVTMALPGGATRLDARLTIDGPGLEPRAVAVTAPDGRQFFSVALRPGQVQRITLHLQEVDSLNWTVSPDDDSTIRLDDPVVVAP